VVGAGFGLLAQAPKLTAATATRATAIRRVMFMNFASFLGWMPPWLKPFTRKTAMGFLWGLTRPRSYERVYAVVALPIACAAVHVAATPLCRRPVSSVALRHCGVTKRNHRLRARTPRHYAIGVPDSSPRALLKSVFGYDAFRPLQESIITAFLGGRDSFALLPTGGGKSLCFQLPALCRDGLTLVVSPLIALMKDQVDQLEVLGIPATFLNSSLGERESRKRMAGLHEGRYKLLYVAPERLLLEQWQENLRAWNVTGIAIDEAHCISEWGHDFRPEYRRLGTLRKLTPEAPVIALTATATMRVRDDIVTRLSLREPEIFVGSFNRPNLEYRVIPKDQPSRQIADYAQKRGEESGIVYCATRAGADRLAETLTNKGLTALPYHAGLTASERNDNQERFLRDDAKIICGTIAFGMGINKPNVRWVIHHDLPKNIEGYYQETGRAGRDGLPAECLLLFSAGDAAKQTHFIDEITNEAERRLAREKLSGIIHYAESSDCRRRQLLAYFGETQEAENCGSCDNCQQPRETYDGTVPAQKLLSCVYRVNSGGRFGVGLQHVIDILLGSANAKIQKWGHDRLSTYGIGNDLPRAEWSAIGRELLRLGLLGQSAGQFPTLELTETGLGALKSRQPITLTRRMATPSRPARGSRDTGAIECDETLFHVLRTVRKRLADEHSVPAYVIFGDNTLRFMAREYPTSMSEMERIPGVGAKKLEDFGAIFATAISHYLTNNPRVRFSN